MLYVHYLQYHKTPVLEFLHYATNKVQNTSADEDVYVIVFLLLRYRTAASLDLRDAASSFSYPLRHY